MFYLLSYNSSSFFFFDNPFKCDVRQIRCFSFFFRIFSQRHPWQLRRLSFLRRFFSASSLLFSEIVRKNVPWFSRTTKGVFIILFCFWKIHTKLFLASYKKSGFCPSWKVYQSHFPNPRSLIPDPQSQSPIHKYFWATDSAKSFSNFF